MSEPAIAMASCSSCGANLSPEHLACVHCGRLVHTDELKQLATSAQRATDAGDRSSALAAWRTARDLLPPTTKQYAQISERITQLSLELDAPTSAKQTSSGKGRIAAGVSATFLVFASKIKFLLLGLTKLSTLLSMLVSLGVYWSLFGYKLALGLIITTYIHEIGHVASLRRYGIAATAPMFLPGFGAVVRLKQYPSDPREDAQVGLAGPIWGLAAALGAFVVALATGWGSWFAIAQVAALINLFNLVPVWQLDGGRGFRALSKFQRWIAVGVIAAAWAITQNSTLLLLLLGAGYRAIGKDAPEKPDHLVLIQYSVLVAALSALTMIHVLH